MASMHERGYGPVERVVLANIPATPEGFAFIKQLRKYLPVGTTIRTRGLNKDRKAVAQRTGRKHSTLRHGVECHLADRLRVYVTQEHVPRWLKCEGRRRWWFSVEEGYTMKHSGLTATRVRWFGPFNSREAAVAARNVTQGVSK